MCVFVQQQVDNSSFDFFFCHRPMASQVDGIKLILQDHERIGEHVKKLNGYFVYLPSSSAEVVKRTFQQMTKDLLLLLNIEANILFPLLEMFSDLEPKVQEEHKQLLEMMQQLQQVELTVQNYEKNLRPFVKLVELHISEVQAQKLKDLRLRLSANHRKQMAAVYFDFKRHVDEPSLVEPSLNAFFENVRDIFAQPPTPTQSF